jgi:hypothetical protein
MPMAMENRELYKNWRDKVGTNVYLRALVSSSVVVSDCLSWLRWLTTPSCDVHAGRHYAKGP